MNKLIIHIFSFMLLTAVASCSKQLNVLPTTSRVDGNAITDFKSAQTVLNGVYYRFANGGVDNNGVPSIKWYRVQQEWPSEMSSLLANPGGNDERTDHTYKAISSYIADIWTWCYDIVNASNGFLKNVEGAPMTSEQKAQMIAEAKFLRAFANGTLLLYFGQYDDTTSAYGIVLRNEFVASGSLNLPRARVGDVYASVIADLDAAIADLPDQNAQPYYASKAAAKLLKARVLINRGTASDYNAVVALTSDVIGSGGYSLEPNVKDIFLTKGFSSPEVILGVQPYPTQNISFREFQYYHQVAASDLLVGLLENDPRKDWMYKPAVDRFVGTANAFTKYYTGDVNNIAPDASSERVYAFRLTEAYLLKAEALSLLNQDIPTAKDLLKEVMGHAGITDFSAVDAAADAAALHELIVKETMINFTGEGGQDWLALRRLPLDKISELVPSIQRKEQLLLPIPQDEVNENDKMVQTPGY